MPPKKPAKLARKSKRVKAIARTRVGSPPPTRPMEEKPAREKPKHKRSWRHEVLES